MMIADTAPAHASHLRTNKKITRPDISTRQRLSDSQIRTVEGIVQSASEDSIQVRGKYYSISGIPLINSSGEHLKKSSLSIGKKVEIFFQEGSITSILIYDDMVE
jgi:hypothetical protein